MLATQSRLCRCHAYLQNSQLVHLLPRTRRYHVLQDAKLLVHLGPPSPLNETMRSFASNLASLCCSTSALLALPSRSSCSGSLCRRGWTGLRFGRFLRLLGIHLNDLAGTRWWGRQRVVIFRDYGLAGARTFARRCGYLGGRDWGCRRERTIRGIGVSGS
jgi:hypothetical protein